ncbi:MAG: ribose-5-phosphate isomerase RpiA [Candidatus Thermoplasmatota archaeon]
MDLKAMAGEAAARLVEHGQLVGLGTGSTAEYAIRALARRRGIEITGIATSIATERLAATLHIPLVDVDEVEHVDITIDGADAVDPWGKMIKGMGGALFREKVVASLSKRYVVVVDESKLVNALNIPVPVEVAPFGLRHCARRLEALGCRARLRTSASGAFITDNGNRILDCIFGEIQDPHGLDRALKRTLGVVETGLFLDLRPEVIVGAHDGVRTLLF